MHGIEKIYTILKTSDIFLLVKAGDEIRRSKLNTLSKRYGLIYEKVEDSNGSGSTIRIKNYKMEILLEARYEPR